MDNAENGGFLILFLYVLFMAGGIWLQIFLSKSPSRWPGLILPIICLLFSFILIFSMTSFSHMGKWQVVTVNETETINHEQEFLEAPKGMPGGVPATPGDTFEKPSKMSGKTSEAGAPWGPLIFALIIFNIPTYVLLAIYFAVRSRMKKRIELEKMAIQDL